MGAEPDCAESIYAKVQSGEDEDEGKEGQRRRAQEGGVVSGSGEVDVQVRRVS